MLVKEIELKKWGNVQGIIIGKEELEELGYLDTNVSFNMVIDNGQIFLIPIRKYPETIEKLFADYDGEPLDADDKFDWGKSLGRELF